MGRRIAFWLVVVLVFLVGDAELRAVRLAKGGDGGAVSDGPGHVSGRRVARQERAADAKPSAALVFLANRLEEEDEIFDFNAIGTGLFNLISSSDDDTRGPARLKQPESHNTWRAYPHDDVSISGEHALAVGSRAAKTGFVTASLLIATGVIAVSGPVGIAIGLGGFIIFGVYDMFEKRMQVQAKQRFRKLLAATEKYNAALESLAEGIVDYQGLIAGYRKTYALNQNILNKIKVSRQLLQEEKWRGAEMQARIQTLEDTLNRLHCATQQVMDGLEVNADIANDALGDLYVSMEETMRLMREVLRHTIEVGNSIFGETFEKAMSGWSNVLSAAGKVTSAWGGDVSFGMASGASVGRIINGDTNVEGVKHAVDDFADDHQMAAVALEFLTSTQWGTQELVQSPDHAELMAQVDQSQAWADMSQTMRDLKTLHPSSGPIFGSQFRDQLLGDEHYVSSAMQETVDRAAAFEPDEDAPCEIRPAAYDDWDQKQRTGWDAMIKKSSK